MSAHAISQTSASLLQKGVNKNVGARWPTTQVHSYLQSSLDKDLHLYGVIILFVLYPNNELFYFYTLNFQRQYPILNTEWV
jgi:hypothetical protein